jgi:energy-coupling factor transport system substrate-specific component
MSASTQSTPPAPLRSRWRAIDFLTAAMLAVAFGVCFWVFDTFIYPVVSLAFVVFPPLGELALGVWLIPAVVAALIIRKPGAALFTEFVAANIELILGNQWGFEVLLSAILQGVAVEVVFALFLWKRFGVGIAALAGAVSAGLEIVALEWWTHVFDYEWSWKLVFLASGVISGAVIAGLGSFAIVRGLARAGALKAFPAGR